MGRIICISNRVALPDPATGAIQAGGLAVGVRAAMESNGGGIWFGWNGQIEDNRIENKPAPHASDQARYGDIRFMTVPLDRREYDGYYKGMANENLWPLMHGLNRHIDHRPGDYSIYRAVNRRFAQLIKTQIKSDDVIWVHDYHLIPLGRELRAAGIQNRIGFFNHIPMAAAKTVHSGSVPATLQQQYRSLLTDLFYYDLVGFQSFRDYENFSSFFEGAPRCPDRYRGHTLNYNGRNTRFGVFPISIETHDISMAANATEIMDPPVRDNMRLLVGAERLDYTKGLTNRLEGFYNFLRQNPEERRHIRYHQITPLSRADITQYKKTIEKTRYMAEKINRDFGDATHQPLAYSEEAMPRDRLMSLFRRSRIALVTPLIDGQNLVAKEYLAAQDPRDPGILILSHTAGAAEELAACGILCVDPQDPDDIARGIRQGLQMSRLDRIDIYRRAISHLYNNDIEHWARAFLDELNRPRPEKRARPAATQAAQGLFTKFFPLAKHKPGTAPRSPR